MRKLLLFLAAALAAAPVDAAIVYLKDGGRLQGTVVSSDDKGIVLYTPQGSVRIPSDRISSIDDSRGGPSPRLRAPERRPEPARRREPDEEQLFGERRQTLSFDLGLVVPLSNVSMASDGGGSGSDGDVGPLFGLQYLYALSPRLSLGGEFQWADRTGTDSMSLSFPGTEASVSGDTLLFLGVVKYSLADRGSVRPFILGGIGAHRTSEIIDVEPALGFVWNDTGTDEARRFVDDSRWGFASTARLGLDFTGGDPVIFTLEAGWTGLAGAAYAATPQGQDQGLSSVSTRLNMFMIDARWGWRF